MKVTIYSVCWNEEFILPYFFKHFKKRFPSAEFVVYDNMSYDNSREIIKANGGKIIDFDTAGEYREDILTSIRNTCWKSSDADWVIVCDMDEFVECDEEFLQTTSASVIKCEGYEMVGNENDIESVDRGVRSFFYDKAVVFKPSKIKEMNYGPGSHRCSPVGEVEFASERVVLKHMKHVSLSNVIERYDKIHKRLSAVNDENNWGRHYKQSIDEIKNTHEWLLSIAQEVPLPYIKNIYYTVLNRSKLARSFYKTFNIKKPIVWKAKN